jgi:CDP-glucose 4,6-dehydratase
MVPVLALVEAVIRAWGSGTFHIDSDPPGSPHEAHFLHLDISKACNELGWRPAFSLDQMIAATVDGYRAELGGGAAVFDHRVAQIRAFGDLVHG